MTATWCELVPDRPVTIGRPLPTYGVALLEAEDPTPRLVATGEVGEIALAGPGVARGYVGLPEKTASVFVTHPATGAPSTAPGISAGGPPTARSSTWAARTPR